MLEFGYCEGGGTAKGHGTVKGRGLHYYRTINYIHSNPVKHGYVEKSQLWPWSSFSGYSERFGRDELVHWWRKYPIDGYGAGWDE